LREDPVSVTGSSFKVAVIQSASVERACSHIKNASDGGASVVLFPEAFISAYPDWVWLLPAGKKPMISELFARFLANSVHIPGENVSRLCEAAGKHSVFVGIGVNEVNTDASRSSVYNSLLYINNDGNILGVHRKLIPTGGERLMWSRGSGDSLISFNTSFGKIGGLICWENFMPLARFAMYQSGVQLYFAPTWDNSESWLNAMRHVAREGGMYVLSCAQAVHRNDIPDDFEFKQLYPADREWINPGNSCIVDPTGKIIAGPLTAKQDILYAYIDLDLIPSQKWVFDAAGHYSRPDVFEFRIKK
jgi:nitrilase